MNLYAALPIMNEPDAQKTIEQVLAQTLPPKALYICVNQPESYKTDPEKRPVFEQNQKTISEINARHSRLRGNPEGLGETNPLAIGGLRVKPAMTTTIHIIDKSTIGWDSKNHGVGWARKTLMDTINEIANPEDIIISLDADTEYPPAYFESVKHIFHNRRRHCEGGTTEAIHNQHWIASPTARNDVLKLPPTVALSNPYYHRLTGHEATDRAILRYEIYMRCYLQNLIRIGSPYAFTALGSAMAVSIDAYRKMGGMAPKKSGEDFYFLQQLSKIGYVETENSVTVYPSNRLSNRVFFGTGPALIKGVSGDWNSYPIYSPKLWDEIAKIYQNFENYFSQEDYQKLKSNAKTDAQLQKFCHEKFDALRILQYLKSEHAKNPQPDEIGLRENLQIFNVKTGHTPSLQIPPDFSFETAKIELLDEIRNTLC